MTRSSASMLLNMQDKGVQASARKVSHICAILMLKHCGKISTFVYFLDYIGLGSHAMHFRLVLCFVTKWFDEPGYVFARLSWNSIHGRESYRWVVITDDNTRKCYAPTVCVWNIYASIDAKSVQRVFVILALLNMQLFIGRNSRLIINSIPNNYW